jgi:hypothetical protein
MTNAALCLKCPYRQRPCAGPCLCSADHRRRDIIELAGAGACPMGYFDAPEQMPARAAAAGGEPAAPMATRDDVYRALWAEIHAGPKAMAEACGADGPIPPDLVAIEVAFLGCGVLSRLPCGPCKGHWARLLEEMPPDLASPDRYFDWTVRAHNAINRRLGKPEMPVSEARCLHGWNEDRTAAKAASIDL